MWARVGWSGFPGRFRRVGVGGGVTGGREGLLIGAHFTPGVSVVPICLCLHHLLALVPGLLRGLSWGFPFPWIASPETTSLEGWRGGSACFRGGKGAGCCCYAVQPSSLEPKSLTKR